jgi:iron complex outermembrane recepter protein
MVKSYLKFGGVVTALILSSPAMAQDAADTEDTASTTGDIVVTAQRRDQSLREVPIAIQAFTGEALEAQGIKSATDVINQVPSASFGTMTPTQVTLQMRGVAQNAAVDPSVAMYLDDIPLGFPGMPFMPNIEALDLERVEVLRGPQGTLYGLGAMGGTVRVITADPDASEGFSGRFVAEGSTTRGGGESYLASGALNIPIIEDRLAARVAVSYRNLGGWMDIPGRNQNDVNEDNVLSIRAKLLFTPTDNLSVRFTYIRNEINTNWDNLASARNTEIKIGTGDVTDPIAFQDTHFSIYGGSFSYDLGFATIENSASYYTSRIPARFVIGGIPLAPGVLATLLFDTADRSKAFTNELRLVSSGDTPFQYIAGIFYRDATRIFQQEGTIGPIVLAPFTINDVQSESISFFGEASYGFSDDLVRVLVGARYFDDTRDYFETVAGVVTTDLTPKFHSFNPRFNVTVKPSDGVMFYANIAKGFRSGILNNAAQTFSASLGGITGIQIVRPDSIWTYEIGGKLELAGRSLFIEGALFKSDWNDFQLQGTSVTGLGFNVNGGNADIEGVEGSITWNPPISGFSIVANGSYVSSKFATVTPIFSGGPVPPAPAFVVGSQLPGLPKWSGSIAANYTTSLGDGGLDFVGGATFIFRDGITDQGGQFDPSTGAAFFTDSRTELSLRAGVAADNWDVTVFMDNVTDNNRSTASLTGAGWYSPRPRTVGVRLGAGF